MGDLVQMQPRGHYLANEAVLLAGVSGRTNRPVGEAWLHPRFAVRPSRLSANRPSTNSCTDVGEKRNVLLELLELARSMGFGAPYGPRSAKQKSGATLRPLRMGRR